MSLTFKDKENIIRKYSDDYKKSKIIELKGVQLLRNDLICESDSMYMDTISKYQYYYGLQNKIDRILDKLDYEYSNFIKQEFLSNNYKTNWWMNYFSRSTYYRIKARAMEKFLGMLYD